MPHVVTSPCIGCKHADCVVVCPAECFHEDDQMLYIDPDDCVDCFACAAECPEEAIFELSEVPEVEQEWIGINAARAPGLPLRLEK
ncbi:MAG: ferredoxin family protein [Pirellulaceae bacterium]|nr:ferredoxin family protein [Pirellulaceae bacterium]